MSHTRGAKKLNKYSKPTPDFMDAGQSYQRSFNKITNVYGDEMVSAGGVTSTNQTNMFSGID